MKNKLIKFLKNLDIYNDYYGGPIIDEIIEHLDDFFETKSYRGKNAVSEDQ